MTIVLGIDTSWGNTSIALVKDRVAITQDSWPNTDNQTLTLVPSIKALCSNNQIDMKQLDVIAVALGPGTFNGLRVGLASAKGLSVGLGKPIVGVSTLEAEAWPFRDSGQPVTSILPFSRSELSSATFRLAHGHWHKMVPEHITYMETVISGIREPTIIAGNWPMGADEQYLNNKLISMVSCPTPRAAAVAEIAFLRSQRNDFDLVATLEPLYLKRPQITPANKTHLGQAPETRAVVWDMDGVIIDSAIFHFQAWKDSFEKRGITYNYDAFRHTFGRRNDVIIPAVYGCPVSSELVAEMSREKETAYRRAIKGQARTLPGVLELMTALKKAGFKQALASSAPRQNIALIIEELNLKNFIDAWTSGEDVERGKPDPEIFLKAVARVGARPQNALVIEDATAGIEAAQLACMAVVAVTTTNPREALKSADLVVDTLSEVSIAEISGIISRHSTKEK